MKTRMFTFLFILITMSVRANDAKYNDTMTKSIEEIYKAQTSEEIQQAANVFGRIGEAEKNKWEPFYYESFGYILIANREKDSGKKDAYLDQAKKAIDKALAIKADESEIVALQGFIDMIRVTVDPPARGMKYSGMAVQAFEKAISLNPENPRAHALLAQMQLGTARFFNAPATEGCATAAKALEKFSAFKSENPLAPAWGRGMTEEIVKNCK